MENELISLMFTKQYLKEHVLGNMTNNWPLKISIVTVCFNSAKTIEQTILSVIKQTYSNVEYIIIDGKSTDGTVDIIKKYQDKIAYFVSEPDGGIYDAMNKGIESATGDYVYFLNSGDFFYDSQTVFFVIQKINSISEPRKSIILGNIECTYNGTKMGVVKPKNKITAWYTPPHQGIFILRSTYMVNRYRNEFKILGDRELLLRLKHCNLYESRCIDCNVALYNLEGVSSNSKYIWVMFKEAMALELIYQKFSFSIVVMQGLKSLLKYSIIMIFPIKIYYKMLYIVKKFKMKLMSGDD